MLVIVVLAAIAREAVGFCCFHGLAAGPESPTPYSRVLHKVSYRYSSCAALIEPSTRLYMERTSGGEGNLSGQGRWGKGVRARRRATNAGLSETVPIDLAANDADVKAGQMPAINDDSSSVAANSPRESGGRSDRRGFILLATVPLVWGTYGPSVKYLYQMGDSTPGLFFNLSCYLVSAAFLTAIAWVNDARRHRGERLDATTTARFIEQTTAKVVREWMKHHKATMPRES